MRNKQFAANEYFALNYISLALPLIMNTMNKRPRWIWLLLLGTFWTCQSTQPEQRAGLHTTEETTPSIVPDSVQYTPTDTMTNFDTLAQKLKREGLVRLTDVDSSFIVDLRYSTADNFTGLDVYGPFEEAYLQPEPAAMLAKANSYLKETHPDHTFYIYDAVRPRSVQRILWDTLDMPVDKKDNYVADPNLGSIHNFGAAVDLTIAGPDGQPIDMGTDFDYFGELAYPIHEERMVEEGRLTEQQVANRKLLRGVMTRAGFTTINSEWWHFNAMSREAAAARYGIVE